MSPHRIYKSPFPPPAVPADVSVSQFLVQHNPDDVPDDKIILSDFGHANNFLTFGSLQAKAALGAGGLKSVLGLCEGDILCIYGQNSVNWALLAHSVMWGGACFSAINPLATSYELVHYFAIAQPNIIAVDLALLRIVEAALKDTHPSSRPRILIIEDGSGQSHATFPIFPRNIITPSTIPLPPYDLSTRDNKTIPAGMCFSSGTSGKPKAVVLTHHNLIAHLLTIRATNPFTHNGHMQEVFFPSFAHIYGIVSAVLLSALVGSHVIAMPRYDFLSYLRRCSQMKATILRLVPATAIRMVKDPEVAKLGLDLSNVRYVMCSGAALSSDIVEGLQRILHPTAAVLNGYGMTECTISLLRETQSITKAGSVGRPAAGVQLRIVSDSYTDVPPGTPGECLIKSPTVFLEYRNNATETRDAFHEGWLKTGDILRVDEEGFLYLEGRKKELIKYKGNQVAPAELEAILLQHPAVVEAGVCGVPNSEGDEVPTGFVTLAETVGVGERDEVLKAVRAWVDERMAGYKRLRGGLFFLEVLPKGNTGKVLRRSLVEAYQNSVKVKARL